jgi:hypothetical protein
MTTINSNGEPYILCLSKFEFETLKLAVNDAIQTHDEEDFYGRNTIATLRWMSEELGKVNV